MPQIVDDVLIQPQQAVEKLSIRGGDLVCIFGVSPLAKLARVLLDGDG